MSTGWQRRRGEKEQVHTCCKAATTRPASISFGRAATTWQIPIEYFINRLAWKWLAGNYPAGCSLNRKSFCSNYGKIDVSRFGSNESDRNIWKGILIEISRNFSHFTPSNFEFEFYLFEPCVMCVWETTAENSLKNRKVRFRSANNFLI